MALQLSNTSDSKLAHLLTNVLVGRGNMIWRSCLLQASILGHMAKLDLLRPRTCFIEFGAGRGIQWYVARHFYSYHLLGVILSGLKPCFQVHIIFLPVAIAAAIAFVIRRAALDEQRSRVYVYTWKQPALVSLLKNDAALLLCMDCS